MSNTANTEMTERLLEFFDAHKRELPWRATRDPYSIWVSEIMLQQTRVSTVLPYFERWLKRFPTAHDLADAPLDDVIEHWAGLGYYTRARNLHKGAKEIVARYAGALPQSPQELKTIPGIGRYTAGAIASIAFDQQTPLVDGNVARVYARLFAIDQDVKSSAGLKRLWNLAATLVPSTRPGDFNQALMELGATICTPKTPSCNDCPVANLCLANAQGRQGELPVTPKRKRAAELPALDLEAAWVQRDECILLLRRRPKGLYGGLWELPRATDRDQLSVVVSPAISLSNAVSYEHQQVLSHRRLRVRVWTGTVPDGLVRLRDQSYDNLNWQPIENAPKLGISSATRSIIDSFREKPQWTTQTRPAARTSERSPSSKRATEKSSKASTPSATPRRKTQTSTARRHARRADSASSS